MDQEEQEAGEGARKEAARRAGEYGQDVPGRRIYRECVTLTSPRANPTHTALV